MDGTPPLPEPDQGAVGAMLLEDEMNRPGQVGRFDEGGTARQTSPLAGARFRFSQRYGRDSADE